MHTSGGGGVSSPQRKLSRGPPGLSRRPTLAHSLQYESFVRLCLVSASSHQPSTKRDALSRSAQPRRSAEVYLQRRVAILEKQVKSLRLAAGALAEAAYLGDTLEPSDSEDEMEAESDVDIEEISTDGEPA